MRNPTTSVAGGGQCGPDGGVEFNALPSLFADDTFDPTAIVSSRIDLEDITEEGFEAFLQDDRDEVKILVEP